MLLVAIRSARRLRKARSTAILWTAAIRVGNKEKEIARCIGPLTNLHDSRIRNDDGAGIVRVCTPRLLSLTV